MRFFDTRVRFGVLLVVLLPCGIPAPRAEPVQVFTSVQFEGVRSVGETELRRALGLPLAADSLRVGLGRLGSVYYERGFVNTTLRPEPGVGGVLHVYVDEGPEMRIARVLVRGARVFSETEAHEALALRTGTVFRPVVIETGIRALLDEYAHRGYLNAEAVLERMDFEPNGVVLGIALSEGSPVLLGEVSIRGNRSSRDQLVRRLSRLTTSEPADLRRIQEAPKLLRRSGLFASVGEPVLYRTSTGDRVGVLLRVEESKRRHTVFGAVGLARDPFRERAYLNGRIDLVLRNIYGTGRDLTVAWNRDVLAGSRLHIGYRERFVFGTPLDSSLDLEQNVRDSTYTGQSVGATLLLPLNRNLSLEVGTGLDRSVFHVGQMGNTLRLRGRIGMRFESLAREEDGSRFGSLQVRAEYASRRNELGMGDEIDRSRVRQTLWSGRFEVGVSPGTRHVLAIRGEWYAIDTNEPRVPVSELYYFGGARSLRGYREEQFRGDQVAFGGLEYRFGDPRRAQLYGFVDAGGFRLHQEVGVLREAHVGTGFGLRARAPAGLFDLSLGLGEDRSWASTKVHVSFLQHF